MKSIDIFTLDQEKAEEYLNSLVSTIPPLYVSCTVGAVCAAILAVALYWYVTLVHDAVVVLNYALILFAYAYCKLSVNSC